MLFIHLGAKKYPPPFPHIFFNYLEWITLSFVLVEVVEVLLQFFLCGMIIYEIVHWSATGVSLARC